MKETRGKTFVVIFGPSAVGKMTVGRALAERSGMKLFHNHMTVEMVHQIFPSGPVFRKLVMEFRRRLIEEAAQSDLPGLIFTYMWALELAVDKKEIDEYASLYHLQGGRSFYVELEASQSTRLERNQSPIRLQEKPTKRDLDWSRQDLLKRDAQFQLNTQQDFFYPDQHLKLNTEDLLPHEAAHRIDQWIQEHRLGREVDST